MTTNNRHGQVAVVAVFVLVIFAVIGLVAVSLLSNESFSVVKNFRGMQAVNVAEGGLRFTVATSLAADSDWSNNADFGPVSLGPGTFSVHYVAKSTTSATLEVTGTVQGVSRKIAAAVSLGSGTPDSGLQAIADTYVMYWGGTSGGSSSLGNNTNIYGDVLVNANLILGNNIDVNGTIEATNNVTTGANFSTDGSVETHVTTPEGQPTLETSYYDGQIAIANASGVPGPRTYSGSLAPGAYYVKGNVTLNSLTLTGVTTIVATGTISVSVNTNIGDQLTVIAGGAVTFDNNINIGNDNLWYSRHRFQFWQQCQYRRPAGRRVRLYYARLPQF